MKSERHVQEGLWMGYYKREKSRLKRSKKPEPELKTKIYQLKDIRRIDTKCSRYKLLTRSERFNTMLRLK